MEKRFILEHIKGLEISQMRLIGKDFETWLETLSKEEGSAYLTDTIKHATALGYSLEEMKLTETNTPLALTNGALFILCLLAGWKGYEIKALREQEPRGREPM